jgi:hypothetical protein
MAVLDMIVALSIAVVFCSLLDSVLLILSMVLMACSYWEMAFWRLP